jgi:GT2 family glycosyltransferase
MRDSKINRSPQLAIRLFAVIVTYKMRPYESSSLQTLLDAVGRASLEGLDLGILVWDNTPGGQDPGEIPQGVRYEAAPENPGLARAYNRALEIAYVEGYDWLLTLDQDSVLPANFLVRIVNLARQLQSTPTIGAIVPQVTGDGRNLSPFQFVLGFVPRWFRYGSAGIPQRATYALNSAATLRVTALREIGGYDPMFPLDVSDINLFHRLYRSGKRVYLAGDLLISHDFSLLKKHGRMSLERYRALLLDECAFWDMNMNALARGERMIRLAGRACKDFLVPENSAFRRLTLAELKRRLLTPRPRRIATWKIWATARCALSSQAADARSLLRQETPACETPFGSGRLGDRTEGGPPFDDSPNRPGRVR